MGHGKEKVPEGARDPLHSPWLQQTFNPPSHPSHSTGVGAEGQSGDMLAPTTPCHPVAIAFLLGKRKRAGRQAFLFRF